MKKFTSMIALCSLFILLSVPLQAQQKQQGNLKVGYVNLNVILEEFEPYQEATQQLEDYRDDIQSEIDQNRSDINQLRQELQDSQYLSQEQRRQKQQQLRKKMQSFQQSRQRSQQMMRRKEQELLTPIRDKVREAVEITAEELEYDVVHRYGGRQPSTVLWVSPDVDFTDQVIERLDQVKPVEDDTTSTN